MSDLVPEPSTTDGLPAGPAAGLRRCGRCRADFPVDVTLLGNGQPDWWVCDPCRAALLGPDAPRARWART